MAAAVHGIRGAGLWVCVCFWACLGVGAVDLRSFRHSARLSWHLNRPTCRGLHGAEVDWWVMLKHPHGYLYSYLDSTSAGSAVAASRSQSSWQHGLSMLNPNPVSHTLGVLSPAATVTSASTAAAGVAHVIFNDADPGGIEHFDFAHAKVRRLFAADNHGAHPPSPVTSHECCMQRFTAYLHQPCVV